MEQLGLSFDVAPPAAPVKELTCAYGERWWPKPDGYDGPHHCAKCEADVERACASFAADVAAGKYNERGYTLNEWKRSGRPAATWRD